MIPITLNLQKITVEKPQEADLPLPETEAQFQELLKRAERGELEAQLIVAYTYRAQAEDILAQFRALPSGSPNMRAPYNIGERNPMTDAAAEQYRQAFSWFEKASQKSAEALYALSLCYAYGEGTPKHSSRARGLLLQAAERGSMFAQYDVAMQYYFGKEDPVPEFCVKQDYEKAVFWLQKAAEAGDCAALYYLGKCCEEGTGTQKDLPLAFALYQRSAAGNPWGASALARCYEYGLGTQKNLEKAIEFYSLAAESGDEEALSALERLQ